VLPAVAGAQSLPGLSLSSPAPSALSTLYVTAPISLDGVTLFQVAEPANAAGAQPVAARANDVSVALDQILALQTTNGETKTAFDPQTLHVEIVRENDQTVLEAVDKEHTDGTPIVTVTSADATYNQVEGSVLAAQWQSTLQSALVRALEIRQPAQQRKNFNLVLTVAAALLLGQGAVLAAIAVVVIGLIVVGIADHFVRPVLIGSATRLPFLWVLIGILGGVETFGLLGLFVGPATMAVLVLLWREYLEGPDAEAPLPVDMDDLPTP